MSGVNDQGLNYVLMDQQAKEQEERDREAERAEMSVDVSSSSATSFQYSRSEKIWIWIGIISVILLLVALYWIVFEILKISVGTALAIIVIGFIISRILF